MSWLRSLDVALFRFINETLSNPLFDGAMPFFSGNSIFVPFLLVLTAVALWRSGMRGRVCLAMVVLVVCLGDPLVVNTIKHAVGRLRPFNDIPDAITRVGRGDSFSMPSAHTANWFAATVVLLVYFRRSAFFMAPLSAIVGFSRIYNGVHYPSDVLAGAVLGAGYATALVWSLNAVWRWASQRWFPLWWQRLPSLLEPCARADTGYPGSETPGPESGVRDRESPIQGPRSELDGHWLRLGYVVIGALLLLRLGYLASGKIELTEDEAYQWLWSKHLALSYYSKPPLIAYTQFLGTSIWGDNEFGVRFFSPAITAALSLMLLRFFAHEGAARVGFWLVLIATATPLLAAGAILMTVDPLSVLFWTAAMLSTWRAIQQDSTRLWLWAGVWVALGVMSKFAALAQPLCWAVFFWLWKPARRQILRPGPWLALSVGLLGLLPLLIWNLQHDWPTIAHLASRGGFQRPWKPTLNFFQDLLLAEVGLLNPVFFVAAIWAAIAFWKRGANDTRLVYLFSMGAPLFIGCLLWTFRARVQPNWIAPSVVPLFCLMAAYWDARSRNGVRALRAALTAGLLLGLVTVIVLHDTNLIGKIVGRPLAPKFDPSRRVRSWKETAKVVGAARERLLSEGKPVFIIGDHYGITGLMAFYLAEAKSRVTDNPIVYYRSSDQPENQFYFWPGYTKRKGESAIYVQQTEQAHPPPERIQKEFANVTDLGLHEIKYRGRAFHRIQLFECRDLR